MSGDDAMIGRLVADRYRVAELLARGGMARVYRARDERLDRDVAMKVLSSPYAQDPEFTARFLGEARAAASISHPSLVHVYDSGTDGGAHFIVMELLDRHRTLRAELEERGRFAATEVLRIGQELLAGLRAVHDRGLVHCDVKASNVMLGPGPAKLIDFGIATAPHEGLPGDTSIGSLHVMSPEQLRGEALTPASDLFSLGAVLYEALTGQAPYPGSSPAEVSAAHSGGTVRPPSTLADGVPGRLDEAILQALRRDPTARFRSADAMAVALGGAEGEVGAEQEDETRVISARGRPAPSPSTGYVPPRAPAAPAAPVVRDAPPRPRADGPPRRRRRVPWALLGSLLVIGAATLVVLFVIVPLLELGRGDGGEGSGGSPSPTPVASAASNLAVVPDLVGMPTADAIEAARAAGLEWTVHCAQDPAQPEGIIAQEPPAGSEVRRGSAFNLYSARISDCR